jgi:hypothetical protein
MRTIVLEQGAQLMHGQRSLHVVAEMPLCCLEQISSCKSISNEIEQEI